jgi:hypothetical protein
MREQRAAVAELAIDDRVARESEYLRTLRSLGARALSASDVPAELGAALPLLARVVRLHWDQCDADVLPLMQPEQVSLAPPLFSTLTKLAPAALATLMLLSDFVGLERVRNACVYVLVKTSRLLPRADEA